MCKDGVTGRQRRTEMTKETRNEAVNWVRTQVAIIPTVTNGNLERTLMRKFGFTRGEAVGLVADTRRDAKDGVMPMPDTPRRRRLPWDTRR
jgi:hypothetical protein